MKKTKNFVWSMMLAVSAMAFTACSSSDDNGNGGGSITTDEPVTLDAPQNKAESALYTINSSSSEYSSIELTESGNYVIIKKSAGAKAMVFDNVEHAGIVTAPWTSEKTRANAYNNIISGSYTKTDDNTYVLEGFGTIVVTKSGDTAASLQITPEGSSAYTLTASVKTQYPDSEATFRLCRTWKMTAMRLQLSVSVPDMGNETFNYDKTVAGGDIPALMNDFYEQMMRWTMNLVNRYAAQYGEQPIPQAELNKYMEEELKETREQIYKQYKSVENIIFTQAGTYMVLYGDQSLAVATWTWNDNTNKSLRFSWNYSNMSSAAMSGSCDIQFSGNHCIITETNDASNSTVKNAGVTLTYQLTEVK